MKERFKNWTIHAWENETTRPSLSVLLQQLKFLSEKRQISLGLVISSKRVFCFLQFVSRTESFILISSALQSRSCWLSEVWRQSCPKRRTRLPKNRAYHIQESSFRSLNSDWSMFQKNEQYWANHSLRSIKALRLCSANLGFKPSFICSALTNWIGSLMMHSRQAAWLCLCMRNLRASRVQRVASTESNAHLGFRFTSRTQAASKTTKLCVDSLFLCKAWPLCALILARS